MLQLTDVTAGYGGLTVLRGVDMAIRPGAVASLLGGNGVGKTTVMKTIVGLVRAESGCIRLDGDPIERQSTHQIFARGVALVPQDRELFRDMTVIENLEIGGLSCRPSGEIALSVERVMNLFPRLRERARQRAGTLSGGEQQMLATGRALVSHPKLLLLDEPTAGLAPKIVNEIADVIHVLSESGQTILLVEQNVRLALAVSSRVHVMRGGRIVIDASPDDLTGKDQIFKSLMA